MLTYPIELTPDDNGTILARCPALPEVVTFGDDEEDALAYAVAAIEEALAVRMARRETIPQPGARLKAAHTVRLPSQTAFKVLLYCAMQRQGVTKAELARRMGIARQNVDRILDLNHASRLDVIDSAFAALEQVVTIGMEQVA